jgi:hypothetical protein
MWCRRRDHPFDGKTLGEDLERIRPPIPESTILGGMMVDRTEINHLLPSQTLGEILCKYCKDSHTLWD